MAESKLDGFIAELEAHGKSFSFKRLLTICTAVFGNSRIRGSHYIFKVPWPGNPRINLQKTQGGKAKNYQVEQVLKALYKLKKKI